MREWEPTWVLTSGAIPDLPRNALVLVLGRFDDVFGPMPFEMIDVEAWSGTMLHASHDLRAYMLLTPPTAAQVGRSGEAGETAFAGSTEGEHAVGCEDSRCAQPIPPESTP